jgi:hypothetical protein
LNIPKEWGIHNVISIEHLEPAPPGNDPYERTTPEAPAEQEIAIEAIVAHRKRRYGRGEPTYEFLTRRKGLSAPYDAWLRAELIPSAILQDYCHKNSIGDVAREQDTTAGQRPEQDGDIPRREITPEELLKRIEKRKKEIESLRRKR